MSAPQLSADRDRALSFGENAEGYDRARPSYPAGLLDWLVEPAVRRVLDVGCGTGIATRLFAARGLDVVGVEPDARMAEIARGHGHQVHVERFEDFAAPAGSFDLVVAAQAWHWVDPDTGARHAAELVRDGGRVAVFWNVAHHDADVTAAFGDIYGRLEPGLEDYSVLLGNAAVGRVADAAAGFSASGRLGAIERRSFWWEGQYAATSWLEHLATHSDHRRLPAPRRAALFDEIAAFIDGSGGTLTVPYETVVLAARRVA